MSAFLTTWEPRLQGVLRVVISYLFLQHATAKLFGFPHMAGFDNLQTWSLIWFAGMIELIGSALLLIGLWSRLVAFVMSGEMAFAYFIAHAPQGHVFSPLLNHGEAAVLYCFVFLFFAAAGPGSWSVDGARGRA